MVATEQAKERFDAHQFDLVVTDILMPGMDGLGLIDAMKGAVPDIKILAISGGGTATVFDFLDAAAKHGAMATLTKSFPMSEFYNAIDTCLQE